MALRMKWMLAGAALAGLMAMGPLASAAPAAAPADLSRSVVPGYPDVLAEYVQIPGATAPGTPAALNTATFLRLRVAADGDHPKPANAVIVGMPGLNSTPPLWMATAAAIVHHAAGKTCDDGQPCRIEIWIVSRRTANLADTVGVREAHVSGNPRAALDYYFGTHAAAPDPGRGGALTVNVAPGGDDAKFHPLTERDLAFLADWGFDTYAGDVDHMIAMIRQAAGSRNVFLAGHSQGGSFLANYAGRMQADGKRGYQKAAGLIFLDGGPSIGAADATADADVQGYMAHVSQLRSGAAPAFYDGGPASSARQAVTFSYFALAPLDQESLFALIPAPGDHPAAGDAFKHAIRLTWQALNGMALDVDPLPGANLQVPYLRQVGMGSGRLDFHPIHGTESACDLAPPTTAPAVSTPTGSPPPAGAAPSPPPPWYCAPTPAMLEPGRMYGWLDGGGGGPTPGKMSKAGWWALAQGFTPNRTNIKPVTVPFAQSGARTLDASMMVGAYFYQPDRYDTDLRFFGRFKVVKLTGAGTAMDIDKTGIDAPVYVIRRSPSAQADNPFAHVTDYTEVNRTGTHQTDPARALSPIDPAINAGLYNHVDIVLADDSLAGQVRPGEPGGNVAADTLVDWVLERSKGRAVTPTPAQLGVFSAF